MVSVIIPAYRASADIPDALALVFAQTFSSFEVIIVDDGSPDATELEAAVAPYRNRVRYLVQRNRGAGAARNTGIRAARGRYVAFLDADDRWHEDFLRRQTCLLDAHPECGLVYSDAVISGDTPLAGQRFMDTAPSAGAVTLLSLIRQQCNIMLSTVVVRRTPLVEAGLFDEGLRAGRISTCGCVWHGAACRCAFNRWCLPSGASAPTGCRAMRSPRFNGRSPSSTGSGAPTHSNTRRAPHCASA
jgi:glycosyltransferase involved in cell wall biosynthesis